MTPDERLAQRLQVVQRSLERALAGSSLCSVSRDPQAAVGSAKAFEGEWYTLRDIERRWAFASDDAERQAIVEAVVQVIDQQPVRDGESWRQYAAGARHAVLSARTCLHALD